MNRFYRDRGRETNPTQGSLVHDLTPTLTLPDPQTSKGTSRYLPHLKIGKVQTDTHRVPYGRTRRHTPHRGEEVGSHVLVCDGPMSVSSDPSQTSRGRRPFPNSGQPSTNDKVGEVITTFVLGSDKTGFGVKY